MERISIEFILEKIKMRLLQDKEGPGCAGRASGGGKEGEEIEGRDGEFNSLVSCLIEISKFLQN